MAWYITNKNRLQQINCYSLLGLITAQRLVKVRVAPLHCSYKTNATTIIQKKHVPNQIKAHVLKHKTNDLAKAPT